jgi:hypothetical protein
VRGFGGGGIQGCGALRGRCGKACPGMGLTIEHDVADKEGAQIWPAAADEAVCVYGGTRGVSVDGEVFEIGTALDEHFPETMIALDDHRARLDCPRQVTSAPLVGHSVSNVYVPRVTPSFCQ